MQHLSLKIFAPLIGAAILAGCVQTNINNPITTNAPPHTEIDATLLQPQASRITKIKLVTPASQPNNVSPDFLNDGFVQAFRNAITPCGVQVATDTDKPKNYTPEATLTLTPTDYTTLQFDKNPPSKNNTQLTSVRYQAELVEVRHGWHIWEADVKLYPSLRFAFLYEEKPDEVLASDIVKQLQANGVIRGCATAN